ncbi:MAG: cell division protein FtsZ [Anaerolineaceae bacterium]|nr:cell division protein FtsZ [Anaerolineaceae bacterium]
MQSKSRSESTPSIKVIGIGGGGCNAINHMIEEGLKSVEFIAVNTNPQTLLQSNASKKVCIGEKVHRGLDGNEDPHKGEIAAEYSADELFKIIRDADLVFIVSTMGGGVGSGAAPVVARIAKPTGALIIGIVTQPFTFEGTRRMQKAIDGINNLKKYVDTLIVFRDDQVKEIDKHACLIEAFKTVDHKLFQGIKGISDLLTVSNLICLNLADLRTIINGGKLTQMIIGKASGEDRARVATEKAISSCSIDFPINKADSVLINFTCASDMALIEVKMAIDLIRESAHTNVNILFGAMIDPDLIDEFQVTVFNNGYESLDVWGEGEPQVP